MATSLPNILFIMTDQLRWDALSCTGGWVRTPVIDRMAAAGVCFTNCVTTSPVCIPARASLATGQYPHNTGVWSNGNYTLSPEANTWMRRLRELGYRTSLFGKTHLHPHQGDLRHREHLLHAYGLDDVNEIGGPRASATVLSHMTARWQEKGLWHSYKEDYKERFSNKPWVVRPSTLPLQEYADVFVGQQAAAYLRDYDRSQPWFCWVSFGGPHEPWDTPEPYASAYDPADMPQPRSLIRDSAMGRQGHLQRLLTSAPALDAMEIAKMRADYAGNVTLIDDQIGHILAVVEVRGELENTVIVLTSDHGEMNGDYGLLYKENFFDGAVRIPLIVCTPDTRTSGMAGRQSQALVELIDVGPTIVEAVGGSLDYPQFGRSLGPVLSGKAQEHRQAVVSEIHYETMIMNHHWKMAINASGEPYLLFDRQADPEEQRNLAGAPIMGSVETDLSLALLRRLVKTASRCI